MKRGWRIYVKRCKKGSLALNSDVSFDISTVHIMLLSSQKPAKAFFLVFAFKICLRHQSVMLFLSEPTPKKNPGSPPASVPCLSILNPLGPNSVQDQFSPYNYPYTVKR